MEATRSIDAAQCPDCGGTKKSTSVRCMGCEYARRGPAKRRPCVGCGKLCRGERCRACWSSEANAEARRIPRQDARTGCTIDGCGGEHMARGYCEKHYTRWKRHGDPLVVIVPKGTSRPTCPACGLRKKHRGACRDCWRDSVRNDNPCIVAACGRNQQSRGYCNKHWHRVVRHGSPEIARLRSIEIANSLPQPAGDCIEWPYRTPKGYGSATHNGKRYFAHRLVWEQQVGPIAAGLELDHLCLNRACVNVNHLEPVTGTENKRRRWARWWASQEAS
ncbi:HNH endonuclease signature motif containing protein [Streptomyces sp. ME02-6987-2C]|uniref:HNH endonuclease signature motif containing protein n=1 Tax=unclassified Streptomyces TaxID=2593676 RepID=UPI0029AFA402|nr:MULTISPECIES: HNH endonuclease signature motif containing protein [unclassified Streptomyces]MDX3345877.1 HNH endonuclease signature motif containing protein [Streptomyces sp. ME02-6979A]MDX3365072.1 HNH endonuclease signature motif containing protein [Streptomyces sp. ME02-6987-2C]MDX3404873.1 HNH endonuclease signature motif containing protein [Streptomyces sp. ME02-6977A]MDX3421643.1 HNH endonuclease signature motif containing protein [Streptomyces sp. ME02-6985-2c]